MIVGLGYKARSGKDTVADFLEKECRFTKVAFADALKEACSIVFALSQEQLYGNKKEVVDFFWNMTPREILQKVGTECFRKGFSDDVWVKALGRRVSDLVTKKRNVVVTDVRFPNEAMAIQKWGGVLVRVDRSGAGASGGIQNHASETSLDGWGGWDEVLQNNGTLADLREITIALAGKLGMKSVAPKISRPRFSQLHLPL